MVKRAKRLGKGIESLKKEIEGHFTKIEKDIQEGNVERGRYHIKEIEKSLLKALELKIKTLGKDDNSVIIYRKRLEKLRMTVELD
ncbi:hypothetical protein HYT57_05155 [Candidatus Woesearchaeota archaeon]|nr:hypothetical protein [Candidatus Woesearchaeota archaeon]